MKLDPPVKYLLVDLDGTLLGNHNLPLSLDFVRRTLGTLRQYGGWRKSIGALYAINDALRKPSKDVTNDKRVVDLFSKRMNLDPEEGRKLLGEGVGSIFPQLKKHFFPVPGSREFLEWARTKYPMTLATNPVWPEEIVELRVRWAGIDPAIFRSVTHVRRMHACKPTQEYYSEILEQEGLKPEDCLLIGDDAKMDLPATRVGIRVFIVGEHVKTTSMKLPRQKAPAWRGNYKDLRKHLEVNFENLCG